MSAEDRIGNIFVKSVGCLFRQDIGISMGTSCSPSLTDLFLCSYESEFLDIMISGQRTLAIGGLHMTSSKT